MSLSHIIPFTPLFKVKITGWLGQERLDQQVNYHSRYLLDTGNFDLSENRQTESSAHLRNLTIETDYFSKDQKQSLRSFIQVNGGPESSRLQLLRTADAADQERLAQDLNSGMLQSLATLEYSLKTSASTVFQLLVKDAHFQSDQTLLPEYSFYSLFFGLDSSFTFLRQQVYQRQHLSTVTARLLGKHKSVKWELEGGATQEWGRLQTDVQLENTAQAQQSAGEAFRNDFSMQAPQYFIRPSAKVKWASWFANGTVSASLYPVRLKNKGLALPNDRFLLLAPQVTLGYQFNDKSLISATYHYTQRMSEFSDYTPAYLFSDYQSVRRGLPAAAVMPGHSGRVSFSFNNRQKQFAWNISGIMRRTDNQLGGQFQIDPYLFITDQYRPVRSNFYGLNAGGHRYFPALLSRFDLSIGIIGSQRENRINGDIPRSLDSRLYSLIFDYGTAFDGWVNVLLSNNLFYSDARNQQEQFSSSYTSLGWLTKVQVTIKPSRRFFTKLYLYRSANRTDSDPFNVAYAMKSECSLTLPKQHSALRLMGVNLLNSRQFQQVSADAFIQSTTSLQAIRPFFLLEWDINF